MASPSKLFNPKDPRLKTFFLGPGCTIYLLGNLVFDHKKNQIPPNVEKINALISPRVLPSDVANIINNARYQIDEEKYKDRFHAAQQEAKRRVMAEIAREEAILRGDHVEDDFDDEEPDHDEGIVDDDFDPDDDDENVFDDDISDEVLEELTKPPVRKPPAKKKAASKKKK